MLGCQRWTTTMNNRVERLLELVRRLSYLADGRSAEIERWRNIANRLGTHMGEGLYTDDWECREYAIAAYADWERQPDAQLYKYDVDPQPVWYFKNGEQV